MNNIVSILMAILIFGLIIFIHELGHFLFARKSGIHVIEFALGMGPKLISKQIGPTVYSLRAFPIGGFCNMLGEDDDVDDERAFSRKSAPARFMTIFGGPLFNFILALVVAIILILMESGIATSYVGGVTKDSPADLAGIEVGDKILEVNDKTIVGSKEVIIYVNENKGGPVEVVIRKGDTKEKESLSMTPMVIEHNGEKIYQIGIGLKNEPKTFITVVKHSVLETVSWIKLSYYGLVKFISGQVSPKEVSGPIGIVSEVSTRYKESVQYGFESVAYNMLFLVLLLSANIGVMNLLPLPALDGGRLVFLFIEMIRRKPIKKEIEGIIHTVGFALLMILMVLVMYNDVVKFIAKR